MRVYECRWDRSCTALLCMKYTSIVAKRTCNNYSIILFRATAAASDDNDDNDVGPIPSGFPHTFTY